MYSTPANNEVYITIEEIEAYAGRVAEDLSASPTPERRFSYVGCICGPIVVLFVWVGLYFGLGPLMARSFDIHLPLHVTTAAAIPTFATNLTIPPRALSSPLDNVQELLAPRYCAEYFPAHAFCIALSMEPIGTFMQNYECRAQDVLKCATWATKITKWGQGIRICGEGIDLNTCYSQIKPFARRLAGAHHELTQSHTTVAQELMVSELAGAEHPSPTPAPDVKCDKCLANVDKCTTWTYMTCQGSPKPLVFAFCFDVFLKDLAIGAVFVCAAIAARSDPVAEMISEPCFFSLAYVIDVLRWAVVTAVAIYTVLVVVADITQCVESLKHNCGYVADVMGVWFWLGVSSSCALGLLCLADMMFLLCTRPSLVCGQEGWLGRKGEERRARMLYTLCCVLLICCSYWVAYIWAKATTCPY